MTKFIVLGLSLTASSAALACPGKSAMTAQAAPAATQTMAKADADPTACAKKASLVGNSCSYTTGMMAQRIIAEGADHTFAGTLASAKGDLASNVAAPYTMGDKVHVVANAVIEQMTEAGLTDSRVSLEGKLLEIDGITYFVATKYVSLAA